MDKIKAFFKKYWLKLVIVFCTIAGALLVFKFFSANNTLKDKIRDVADESRKKVVEIDTARKVEQAKTEVALRQNDVLKKDLEQQLQSIQRIANKRKRLEALILFHERIKKI